MTAEGPCLIRRSGDDSARPVAANEDRLAAQVWMIELLDGREERVHIDMQNGARCIRHGDILRDRPVGRASGQILILMMNETCESAN